MRFVMQFVPPWIFKLAEAIDAGDMTTARALCWRATTQEPVEFSQDRPFDHAMRLVVARADNNLVWLEEAEAFLAAHGGDWPAGTEPHESVLATYHLAGLMRLSEPARAATHFEAALAMAPAFLPARIELEILRSGRDRNQIFAALGVAPQRTDWGYMLAASQLGLAPTPTQRPPTHGAICLRGLCTAHTLALVRLYRWLNPKTPIIVATWADTPNQILQAISESAEVILAPDPETAGSQNKNRQIVLARAALLTAKRADISHVLLARTDIAMFREEIISNLQSTYELFPVDSDIMAGRIIVSDIFTRKFFPFHVSDIVAYGAVSDLMRLWSAPYEVGVVHNNTEQYISNHLYESLDLKYKDTTMNNYYRFLRNFFVVRDFSWFDGLWLKKPELRTAVSQVFADACISQVDWERLYHGPPSRPTATMGCGDIGVMLQAALGIARI
jgi:hypothetical protein